MKSLPGSFTLQRAVLVGVAAVIAVVALTTPPQNSFAHRFSSRERDVSNIRISYVNATPLATELPLNIEPQVRCRNERQRFTALMNQLRLLEGSRPRSTRIPTRIDPGEDPEPAPVRDEEAIADWHRRHDAELMVLRARLASPDCRTSNPPEASVPPYDLVWSIVDDNGIPLNPMLGSQTWSPNRLTDISLCGGNEPGNAPCTSQVTWRDISRCAGGHVNWMLATYEGRVYWADHSNYLLDDDYSFALYRADHAGMTRADLTAEGSGNFPYLHCEFNSGQTINHFNSWFWDTLHQAVDSDGGKGAPPGGTPRGPWLKTRSLFDDKEAIVMGLYGLDCAHSCGAELHPVYAMAIHLKDSFDDDTWAIFVRNWGDQGFCSSGQTEIESGKPFTFSFRFKRPGALAVDDIPAVPSDPRGERGTIFYGDHQAAGTGWSGPSLIPNVGAVVTFTLPPPSQRQMINGMLHIKWVVGIGSHLQPKLARIELSNINAPDNSKGSKDPEKLLGELIIESPPGQRETLVKSLGASSVVSNIPVKLQRQALASRRVAVRGQVPVVKRMPDNMRERQYSQKLELLRSVYGSRITEILQTKRTPAEFMVPADVLWVDTGVTLMQGERFSMLASGSWSNTGPPALGPDGFRGFLFPGALLPSASLGSLIGKVGDKMFAVGGEFSGTSPASGRLFLSINDTPTTFPDNQGELLVKILLLDRRSVRLTPRPLEVTVPANVLWVDTGVTLKQGESFSIAASGLWSNAGPPALGPDGFKGTLFPAALLPSASLGSLIGKVGDKMFAVGGEFSGTSPASGRLFLSINDTATTFADNQGELLVSIRLP